jgi:O-antigen ligase
VMEEIRFPTVDSIPRRAGLVRTALSRGDTGSDVLDGGGRQHNLNARLAIFLCLLVILVPVPIGGVRPAAWALSATAIGALGTWYTLRIAWVGGTPRVPLSSWSLEALLSVIFCGFLFAQVVPFGPFEVQTADGHSLTTRTMSLSPGDTLLMLMRQLGYMLFFFLVMQVAANRRRARMLLRFLFVIVAIYAVVGLTSLRWGDTLLGMEKTTHVGYATGTFVNRNSFATFLAAGFAVGVALLLHTFVETPRPRELWKWWTYRLGIAVALALITAALLATGSRMGLFAGLFGGALIVLVVAALHPRKPLLWVVLVAVVSGGGLVLVYGGGLLERVIDLRQATESRGELYNQIWQAIILRPWLGYGGGSFSTAFPLFQHPPLPGDVVWEKAHSSYLALWFELGLAAGTIPIVLIACITVRLVFSIFRSASGDVAVLAALGTIVVFAVHSLADFSLEIPGNTYLFLAVAALGASWSSRVAVKEV